MQRRAVAAEHALKKAELHVRSAELRAQSAESELIQLRKHYTVRAHFSCKLCCAASYSSSNLPGEAHMHALHEGCDIFHHPLTSALQASCSTMV